jgi:hypothetical protein
MAHAHTNSRGDTYYLHAETVALTNGRPLRVYFFNRRLKPAEALNALPAGDVVAEKAANRLPYLKRVANGDEGHEGRS